ncbi:hypothetical protein AB5J52_06190 [Streptomyces sp. R39]|uniref:Uncharacterized protein n=1 Tax=Streptomyces sp. R39 TaxID=3238631 RepID=A0AB39QHG8_9ACTN
MLTSRTDADFGSCRNRPSSRSVSNGERITQKISEPPEARWA